jgi:hypothetical protein
MEIEIKTSKELSISEWQSYTKSFNEVFKVFFTIDEFKHKYLNTIDGLSYHAILKSEGIVIGGVTVIPFEYIICDQIIRIGFPLDVFILCDYRNDFLSFFKMYRKLKSELVKKHIDLTIITPNEESYHYWKKIIKMNDIGELKYYILPIRISKVIKKLPRFLNTISRIVIQIQIILSYFLRFKEKQLPIRINRSKKIIEKQRYTEKHQRIKLGNAFFSYRIIDEEGVKTCYLIDFYNHHGIKNSFTLYKAIRYINGKEDIDLVIFVGKLNFFQILLFKVPHKLEPRHLHFMGEVIRNDKIKDPDYVYNFKNWDFGLFNYDVR